MSRPPITIDGPHHSRRAQRRARRYAVAGALLAMAAMATPYVAALVAQALEG